MKLVRRNKPDLHNQISTSMNLDIDIKSYIIKFIQSYLVWIHTQNPKFVKYLTNEELSNYLVNNIELPIWFQYLLKTNTFKILIEVNNYISKYKKDTELMESELPIIAIDKDIDYTNLSYPVLPKLSSSQRIFIKNICDAYHLIQYEATYVDYELCKQIKQMNLQTGKEVRYHA